MQKKIMLALMLSSNMLIICQEGPEADMETAPDTEQVAPKTNGAAPSPTPTAPSSPAPVAAPAPAVLPATTGQPAVAPVATTTQVQPASTGIAATAQSAQQVTAPTTEAAEQAEEAKQTAEEAAPGQEEQEQPEKEAEAPAPKEAPASKPKQVEQPAPQEPKTVELPKQEPFEPQPQEDEDSELEIKGIDTVDVNEPKGNWLYKRIWWEKAERTYEKIKQLTDKILETRMNFFIKRNDLDRTIIDFYADLGFKQGELNELIDFMTTQLEHEREKEGSLDEKERELLALLTQEKKNIEQLKQGSQNIAKIDRALEDALMKLVEQLNLAKYYEQQAWEHFKAINRELSDKKARELFYSMDTYWRNLNSINSYLSDSFAKYFDQLTQKVNQETDKIKTNVQALSEKGISLEAQALAMKKECKVPIREEAATQEPQEAKGILGTIWGWITAPFSAISNMISGLFGGGASEDLVLVKPARRAAQTQPEPTEESAE